MKKFFSVPVTITVEGTIDVEASSPEEAIRLAKKAFYDLRTAIPNKCLKTPLEQCVEGVEIEVDFANGEDVDCCTWSEEDK